MQAATVAWLRFGIRFAGIGQDRQVGAIQSGPRSPYAFDDALHVSAQVFLFTVNDLDDGLAMRWHPGRP